MVHMPRNGALTRLLKHQFGKALTIFASKTTTAITYTGMRYIAMSLSASSRPLTKQKLLFPTLIWQLVKAMTNSLKLLNRNPSGAKYLMTW